MSTNFPKYEKIGNNPRQVFKEENIYPILTASRISTTVQRQKWLTDIRALVNIPDEHYEALYTRLIEKFAEMVQILPVNNEARLFSLLDEGLLRGIYILELYYAENATAEIDPLMQYVLFSASLLFDIGFVVENRMVIVSDKEGGYIREWYPHTGPLLPQDGYYKIRRGGGMPTWLCRRVSTILAKQTMPEIGFNWIAKDAYAFNVWLSLLFDDKEGAGALSLLFSRATEMLEEFKTTQEFFLPFDIEAIEPEGTKLGEEFLKWLQDGLADGSISINKTDSNVQALQNGKVIIKQQALLDSFADSKKVDRGRVLAELKKLGVTGQETTYRQLAAKTSTAALGSALFGHQATKLPEQKTFFSAMTTTLESHINVSHVERPGMPSNPIVGILLNDLASAIIMRTTHAASVLAAHIQILGEQGIEEKLPNVPSLSVQATQTAFATGR